MIATCLPPLVWRQRAPHGDGAELTRLGHLSSLAATVLAARGWQAGPALGAYLSAEGGEAPDYLCLTGVREGAARLAAALAAGERITICGDYDMDGVCATALLVGCLRARGADVDFYLPHRIHDGYGLNAAVLERFSAGGSKLLVTVDNGITSVREIALARALGLDVILTDHHLPGPDLPPATVVINPQLMPDSGPFGPMAGVGVAYALAIGLETALGAASPTESLAPFLDLVALGTLGDMAPLIGENRRLVRRGLAGLATSPRAGLAGLADVLKLKMDGPGLAEQLAQRLIPRLNAAGRMAHPALALELLLCEDASRARALAAQLEQLNRQRRTLTEATEAACLAMLEGHAGGTPGSSMAGVGGAIILAHAGWHHGVTSIVAGRLANRFNRPAILFAPEADGWRGSGRSVPNFDLHAALAALASHLGRFGGHAAAVGLTVSADGLDAFERALQAYCTAHHPEPAHEARPWEIDAEVPLDALTYDNVASLGCLQPTGAGNPAPTLLARGLFVRRQQTRGPNEQHLFLALRDAEGSQIEAIGFGFGHLLPLPERVDLVYTPIAERWRGRERVQLRLLAVGAAGLK